MCFLLNQKFLNFIQTRRGERLLEIIPGSLVWLTFTAAIILSFIQPLWVIYFIIVFDFYWLVRISYFVFWLIIGWRRYRQEIKFNWLEKVKSFPDWERIYHLIFLPTFRDELPVLVDTFQALLESTYPTEKMIVVLAGEERDQERFEGNAAEIKKRFKTYFKELLITLHPKDLAGEIAGKGSNLHWAGRQAKDLIDRLEISYQDVIVSAFDIDTQVHPQYFARLTFAYLNELEPTRASYQPLALYNNNIWDSPSFTRVVANSTTFWLMTELARPEQFMTFSSHSMPFQALVDVGFWQKDIVTEDSRIFLQCFKYYQGDYKLVPLYVPVSMDTVAADSFWQTVKNQYFQMRRWAWSVEHFPYMVKNFLPDKLISRWRKTRYIWKMLEGAYSWATAPILIFVLGRLPLLIAHESANVSVLVQNTPFVLETLMRLAMVGIFISAILNVLLLPTNSPKRTPIRLLVMVFQWVLLPITMVIFGSLPAIESQTRLMLGKYLGFWSTQKYRRQV